MGVEQERRKAIRNKLEKTNLVFELNSPNVVIRNNGKIYDVSCLGMGIIDGPNLPKVGSIITLDFILHPEQNSIISLAKVIWTDSKTKRFGVEFKTS